MSQVNPTRMNLLSLRAQISRAEQGADLLSRKKEALLREFFKMVARSHELRRKLADDLRHQAAAATIAEGRMGAHTLARSAMVPPTPFRLTMIPRNLWGVRGFDVQHDYRVGQRADRPYSPRSTDLAVDELAEGFGQILLQMLELVPQELWLRRIGEEIRRTNRKINGLEQHVLPRLKAQARYIDQVLQERARDDNLRLKRLKNRKERSRQ